MLFLAGLVFNIISWYNLYNTILLVSAALVVDAYLDVITNEIGTPNVEHLKWKANAWWHNKIFGFILASLVSCPPPSGKCYWEPEETCTSHSDCQWLSASKWIGLCCPHICEGKKVCRDFRGKYMLYNRRLSQMRFQF